MKRVICDQCRKEEPPDHYGLAPKGWFTVDVRGDYKPSKDYCSVACVVAAFAPLVPDEVDEVDVAQSATTESVPA